MKWRKRRNRRRKRKRRKRNRGKKTRKKTCRGRKIRRKKEEGGRNSRKRRTRTRNKTDNHITISSPGTHSKRNYQRGSVKIATRTCGRAFRTLRGTYKLEKQKLALLAIGSSD